MGSHMLGRRKATNSAVKTTSTVPVKPGVPLSTVALAASIATAVQAPPAPAAPETGTRPENNGRPSNCAFCGSALHAATPEPRGIVRCPDCGAGTTDPWPSEAALEQAYSTWYRPESGRFGAVGDAFLRRSRGRLARRLVRIAPPGAVLDVGCGDGALLDALHAAGRDATGLERRSLRPDVLAGELEDVRGEWAAVVFWHSLEHLPRPERALDRAASMLAPRGVLCVALPNFTSLQARAFGARWFALDLPRHLVHVPSATLVARLRERGLVVERVSQLRGGQVVFGWLHGLTGLLPGRPDLYDAIRTAPARRTPMSLRRRAATIAAAGASLPVALPCALFEAALGRGGTVYVEARRA